MRSFLSRWFSQGPAPEPLQPGIHHFQTPPDSPQQYRLHLRIDPGGTGVLIVNAATVLHLNASATAHALELVRGASEAEAVDSITRRFWVSRRRALHDQRYLRDQVLALATNPELDPVTFLDVDRREPYASALTAPYRLDIALTYTTDPDGAFDPLARARVDRELNTDEWKEIISKAWEAGIPHITFTGGEPTRRPDLVDLVTHAESLGQVSGVLTQGRRLANQAFLNQLSQAGLDHLLIVLLPGVEENLKGIENAIASDVFTVVHLTVAREAAEAEKWLDQLRAMGLSAISLSAAEASPESAALLARVRGRADYLGLSLVWDLPVPYSTINPVHLELEGGSKGSGSAWLYVEPDGDVLPGQGIDRILGNFLHDPWDQIWEKAKSLE